MIDNTQLEQIANLAKLNIADDALDATTKDLNNILALAEKLSEINTDNIKPMAHPLHMTQRLREDKVGEQNQVQIFQSIAPKIRDQYYLVPTVISNPSDSG